jgi:hypothetical protein
LYKFRKERCPTKGKGIIFLYSLMISRRLKLIKPFGYQICKDLAIGSGTEERNGTWKSPYF